MQGKTMSSSRRPGCAKNNSAGASREKGARVSWGSPKCPERTVRSHTPRPRRRERRQAPQRIRSTRRSLPKHCTPQSVPRGSSPRLAREGRLRFGRMRSTNPRPASSRSARSWRIHDGTGKKRRREGKWRTSAPSLRQAPKPEGLQAMTGR